MLVFSKRLVDKSWKLAFRNEVADADLVHKLSEDDRARLEDLIARTPNLMREFEASLPPPIDHAMDLALFLPDTVQFGHVQEIISREFADIAENGLTNDCILERIAGSELAAFAPLSIRNARIRFTCKDYELRDNAYVFREVRLIPC